jgi:hypothetical protein
MRAGGQTAHESSYGMQEVDHGKNSGLQATSLALGQISPQAQSGLARMVSGKLFSATFVLTACTLL